MRGAATDHLPNAHSLFEAAESYHSAAETIFRKEGRLYSQMAPAFYLLVGFAFELCLKALLSMDGIDEKRLRAISHDLIEAYAEVIQREIWDHEPHQQLLTIIYQIAPHHHQKSLTLRYMPRVATFNVPDPKVTLTVLDHLVGETRMLLRGVPDK